MLAQGADPTVIEAGGVASGMPVPPLALSDAVALDLIHQINRQAARDLGDAYTFTRGYEMVGRMVEQEGRKGKKSGQGFYDYGTGGSKTFWPRLREFASQGAKIDMSIVLSMPSRLRSSCPSSYSGASPPNSPGVRNEASTMMSEGSAKKTTRYRSGGPLTSHLPRCPSLRITRPPHSAIKCPAPIGQLISTASPTSKNFARPVAELASSASSFCPPGVSIR